MSNRVKAHTRYKMKDGTIVPGASTISGIRDKSGPLVVWANKLGLQGIDAAKYKDEKADIGTCAHYRIMCELTGQTPILDEYAKDILDKADNCLLSYYEWKKKHTIELVYDADGKPYVEHDFVSEQYKFGGCIDFYGKIDGELELLDFKTGKGIYDNYFFQLGGYEILLAEAGLSVLKRRILNIPRAEDETFNEKEETETRMIYNRRIFLSLLSVYWDEKALKTG